MNKKFIITGVLIGVAITMFFVFESEDKSQAQSKVLKTEDGVIRVAFSIDKVTFDNNK